MGKYFEQMAFGEANKDLTVEHAYKVGRYIGCILEEIKIMLKLLLERYKKKFLYVRICTCCWTYSKWC